MDRTQQPQPGLQTRSLREHRQQAAYARWRGRRIVRLDDPELSPTVRHAILMLIAGAKAVGDDGSET